MASVTKLFTTTAVMQLAEQRKLDLHADVNRYLRLFQLPENYPQPVTLAELLTHTAGFEDRAIGVAAHSPCEVQPLGMYLARNMPKRVRPPGQIISYSNHGMALAGYIAEAVSGMPYTEYMARNILVPLGMKHSGFLPSPELMQNLATGYDDWPRGVHPAPYDYFNIRPASGLCATATDMAHFIIAQLGGGGMRRRRSRCGWSKS